jgi:DHA1 family bicyclomycin/chloramphenicol resistance-like MFS transporter
MSIGAGASALVSYLQNSTSLPMTGVMAASPVLALSIFLMGRKIIVSRADKIQVEEEEVEVISTL